MALCIIVTYSDCKFITLYIANKRGFQLVQWCFKEDCSVFIVKNKETDESNWRKLEISTVSDGRCLQLKLYRIQFKTHAGRLVRDNKVTKFF